MARVPTETTVDTDWPEAEESNASLTLQPGVKLGGFVIEDFVGNGGMGVVYQATHLGTEARVALKTLHRVNPRAEARLKNEFRFLARVRDEHLVQMYEMHTVDERCFLTMEFIEGEILADYLRPRDRSGVRSYEQVKECFVQIARGLYALHEEGLLHLDLKPDNVMVDRTGKVKILDFGLVAPLRDDEAPTGPKAVGGTPRYMSPERYEGGEADEATDWFAFGVMLTETLCPGWQDPKSPAEFPSTVPPALSQLCGQLLSSDRSERPRGPDVLAALGATLDPRERQRRKVSSERRLKARQAQPLVGRDADLNRLRTCLAATESGQPHWIEIVGESGVGKTALLRTFFTETLSGSSAVVLRGSCHERESVPYQGLEEVMDGLARRLLEAPGALTPERRELARGAELLFSSFSDLCGDSPVASVPADPVEKRRRAFSAIKALLECMTRDNPVVMIIDDVQWGDADGARLLAEFLVYPTPARLMVLTTSRAGSHDEDQFVREANEALKVRGTSVRRERLHLGRLTGEQVRLCLGAQGMENADAIVQASGGLPFLAEALGGHAWKPGEQPSLEVLIHLRLESAPSGALDVLRAVSLSPSPLVQSIALGTVPEANQRLSVLAALRHADLVRTTGGDPEGPIEPYHAMISSTVQAQMSSGARREVRLHLAEALSAKGFARAEHLASLYHLAGELSQAARLAPIAAQEAEASLAFEAAAQWYQRAAQWTPRLAAQMLPRQARCLEYAGRSAEAAMAYESAAGICPDDAMVLTRAAGAAWLNAGHVDRGLLTLAPELELLGAPLASSEKSGLMRCMSLLVRLWWRGVEFEPRESDQCEPAQLARVDALWNAGKGIGLIMPMRGLALQLECMHAALDAREPLRAARSLAVIGPISMGSPIENLGRSWIERANELGRKFPNDYLSGVLTTFDALTMCARWDPPGEIARKATEGLRMLKRSGEPSHWEQTTAMGLTFRSQELLCDFQPLQEGALSWLAESTDRGDLFALAMAGHFRAMHLLAEGKLDEAELAAISSTARWSRSAFTVQHYYVVRYRVQCHLYRGNHALAKDLLDENWRFIVQAQLLRNPISRPEILLLKAVIELGSDGKGTSREPRRIARAFLKDSTKVSIAHGKVIRAALEWARGNEHSAERDLREAVSLYEEAGMVLFHDCSSMLWGEMVGDVDAVKAAVGRMNKGRVAEPRAYARIHLPAFSNRAGSRRG